jgi:diadenosine tetraphosphate (Ap4A) HIT family hydrolase
MGAALQTVFQPTRVGLLIAGLEVPHMHIHVVPIDGMHDLDFSNAATSVPREDLEEVADAIRNELEAMGPPGAGS